MSSVLRFDCFEVDSSAGHLLKRGVRIRLREQSFKVLALLLERAGQVVTRDDLRRQLWPEDVFVDFESSLNTAVARLREVLGDSAERPRFIETLPKRGYRFVAPLLDPVDGACPQAPAARRPRVLVLPFLNLSGEPSQDYVSDGLTEELIADLAALAAQDLAVIARTTAMRHRESRKDVAAIGRGLRVEYVVEGSVRAAGAELVVNAQLIPTWSGPVHMV
jgi:TolB-like protein